MKLNVAVQKATELALKSTMLQKHGALIVNKQGDIVGQGYNHMTDVFSHSWSCHAEIAALLSMGPMIKSCTCELVMIVVRANASGELKLSTPCEKCKKQIIKFGIKKVYYSTSQ